MEAIQENNESGNPKDDAKKARQRDTAGAGRASQLSKIISGGQTGADRAGLEAARELGLATGGTTVPGFLTSAGRDPSLGTVFGLVELPKELAKGKSIKQLYVERSKKNVDDADGTIIFMVSPSPGSGKTIGYCKTGRWVDLTPIVFQPMEARTGMGHRPFLVISLLSDEERARNIRRIREFVLAHGIRVLNIAGNRAKNCFPGFSDRIKNLLVDALTPLVAAREESHIEPVARLVSA